MVEYIYKIMGRIEGIVSITKHKKIKEHTNGYVFNTKVLEIYSNDKRTLDIMKGHTPLMELETCQKKQFGVIDYNDMYPIMVSYASEYPKAKEMAERMLEVSVGKWKKKVESCQESFTIAYQRSRQSIDGESL